MIQLDIGESIDFPYTFIDLETKDIIDPTSIDIQIYHMDGSTKIIDLTATPMVKLEVGKYTYEHTIPDTYEYGEIYNALIIAVHPVTTKPEYYEYQFIVRPLVPSNLVRGHFTRD